MTRHRSQLTASSDFFRNILRKNKHSHPLIYLSGVKAQNLQCILDYIYLGEVKVFQGQLDEFLESAHKLNIRGLATVQTEDTGVKEEIQEILAAGREHLCLCYHYHNHYVSRSPRSQSAPCWCWAPGRCSLSPLSRCPRHWPLYVATPAARPPPHVTNTSTLSPMQFNLI